MSVRILHGDSRELREHWCACGAWGCYGEGNAWFCGEHVPAADWAARDAAQTKFHPSTDFDVSTWEAAG